MKCPFCEHLDTEVKDSRVINDSTQVKRRRCCVKCKQKFTTLERTHLKELFVVKRSGVTKKFDPGKIAKAIDTAMRKRPISEKKIQQMVDNIVQKIENLYDKEIPSKKIGEMIMGELSNVDPVAYIRFASVYQEFASVSDFTRLIGLMRNDKGEA